MTQPMPSACPSSHAATTASRSATEPCSTGTPLLRIDVGTFASGSTARITGSASAMTSAGVR